MTRLSRIRAITGRVGPLQSEGKIGSHTTRTLSLFDFSCFKTSSAAEAPRRQPGHVGDKRRTIRALEVLRLNSFTKASPLLRRVSGGWPFGVIAANKKYQASAKMKASPRSPSNDLLFAIRDNSFYPAMRLAISCGNTAMRITITTAIQKSTRLAVLLSLQDFLKYSCTEPMHRNAIEASNSQRL